MNSQWRDFLAVFTVAAAAATPAFGHAVAPGSPPIASMSYLGGAMLGYFATTGRTQRHALAADTVKTVAGGDEIAFDLVGFAFDNNERASVFRSARARLLVG